MLSLLPNAKEAKAGATSYFGRLNYAMANEDSKIERELLARSPRKKRVLSIAGSGARCISLAGAKPEVLQVVDVSELQLALTRLRFAAAQKLEPADYCLLLGYPHTDLATLPPSEIARARISHFTQLNLSEEDRKHWLSISADWTHAGFSRLGRWENHFRSLNGILAKYFRIDVREGFQCKTISEQRDWYERNWPHARFNLFLKIFASRTAFNQLLYRGNFSGRASQISEAVSPSTYLAERLKWLWMNHLASENFFLQLLFLGDLKFANGVPDDADAEVLRNLKQNATEVRFSKIGLGDALAANPYDFYSLSDVISYLPNSEGSSLLNRMHRETPPGAQAILRSFLSFPKNFQEFNWRKLPYLESTCRQNDRTGVYRFHCFEKN